MATECEKKVVIIGKGQDGQEATTEGIVHIVEYDHNDRVKRAAKAWIISWALAVASIPLIIAHWVLVPGFLIAGPFMARKYFRIESTPKGVDGPCPLCNQDVAIKMEGSDKLPLWSYCKENRHPVQIKPVEEV